MAKGKFKLFCGDRAIWFIMLILAIFSVIEVYSSIGKVAYDHDWNVYKAIGKHVFVILLSYVSTIVLSNLNYGLYKGLARVFFYFILVLLAYVFFMYLKSRFVDIGNGKAAVRWIELPVIGQFQPSELAKYALIIYLSERIVKYRDSLKDRNVFLKLMAPVVLTCGFIFPENFSTAGIVFIACFILMFVAGVNWKYLLVTLVAVLAVVGVVLYSSLNGVADVGRSSTWVTRITDWLNPDDSALTQTNQAKMAIASGGFFGNGIGSTIQGRFLSESHTDFIYAVIVEELGLLAALFILMLYITFFIRCMMIANGSRTTFGSLLVAGIGLLIFMQALINMGVAVGYLPVTGQTLPLISFGGTSYVITCSAIGMIQSVYAFDKKKKKQEEMEKKIQTTDNSKQNDTANESNN